MSGAWGQIILAAVFMVTAVALRICNAVWYKRAWSTTLKSSFEGPV
jgi:hypothetical protein